MCALNGWRAKCGEFIRWKRGEGRRVGVEKFKTWNWNGEGKEVGKHWREGKVRKSKRKQRMRKRLFLWEWR